jgi:hypothetical protein
MAAPTAAAPKVLPLSMVLHHLLGCIPGCVRPNWSPHHTVHARAPQMGCRQASCAENVQRVPDSRTDMRRGRQQAARGLHQTIHRTIVTCRTIITSCLVIQCTVDILKTYSARLLLMPHVTTDYNNSSPGANYRKPKIAPGCIIQLKHT